MTEPPKLFNNWLESEDDFFNRVEVCGGWPMQYRFVSFYHSGVRERACMFGDVSLRTEWWTTAYSRDDYLWWKLSPERKRKEAANVRQTFAAEVYGMARRSSF